ncbi:MAG: hypothetical protein HYX69_16330 [Planctomycetia bacterium]|nr:hypothetical protein [Planctomycetia bacterium]
MAQLSHTNYGPVVADLLGKERPTALGPGKPDKSWHKRLKELSPEALLAPRPVKNRAQATATLAGLWLYFDFLDESHKLSQSLDTVEGSFWHGIMHRREPDYENARYWFRRVRAHPVYARLAAEARALAAAHPADQAAAVLSRATTWDPLLFVDLCEAAAARPVAAQTLCKLVQQREWRLLFDFCYEQA